MKHSQLNSHQAVQSLSDAPKGNLLSSLYAAALLALLLFGSSAFAATTVEPIEQLSEEEMVDLVSPIALYPDDLLAIVLPASTYPLQIVQAARFLEARKLDTTLEPDEGWDDSIIALLNYPEVIDLLNDDLDWTWRLGEAVLIQEADMIVAVAEFRERARIAGNLESDDRQIVAFDDEGAIEIKPADPEVIYVPYYEPARVTVYQRYPVYHYYPRAYPVYYYPYSVDHHFSTGFFWGVTSAFSIGWHTRHLHLHHYGYAGHPYYQRTYHDPYYYRRPHLWLSHNYASYYDQHHRGHYNKRHHGGNHWQPDHERAGSRPHDRRGDNWQEDRRHGRPLMSGDSNRQVAQRRERRTERSRTVPGGGRHRTSLNPQNRVTIAPNASNRTPGARTTRNTTPARQPTANTRARSGNRRIAGEQRATLAPDLSDKKVMDRPARRTNNRRVINEPNAPRVRVATGSTRRAPSQQTRSQRNPVRVVEKSTPARQVRRRSTNRQQVTVAPTNVPKARSAPRRAAPTRQARNKATAPVMRQPKAPAAAPSRPQSKPQKAARAPEKSEKSHKRRADNRRNTKLN